MLASSLAWSFSGVLSRSINWSGFTIAGFRGLIAVLMYACVRKSFKVKFSKRNIIGGLGVSATSILYMIALKYTSSANAIVLQYSMPIYVVLINLLVFKQKPLKREIIVVLCVFVGVILCCLNDLGGGNIFGDILALVSAVTYTFVFITSKYPDADPVDYTYIGNLMSMLLTFLLFTDPNVHFAATETVTSQMVAKEWLVALLMGLSLGTGYILIAKGMKLTSPITAAVLSNAEPVLNPVWVYIAYGENNGITGIIGMIIVLSAVTVYSCLPQKTDNLKTNGEQ